MLGEWTARERVSCVQESFNVYAYWGDRRESPEEILSRTTVCLDGLAGVHPSMGSWWHDGTSPVVSGSAGLLARNREGVFVSPSDGETKDRGGFRLAVYNDRQVAHNNANEIADDTPALSMTTQCGQYDGFPGSNFCILRLPSANEAPEGLMDHLPGATVCGRTETTAAAGAGRYGRCEWRSPALVSRSGR